jgi:hypothetical protein
MDTPLLAAKFARIGARLKVADRLLNPPRTAGAVSLDVRTDQRGEFFEVAVRHDTPAEVEVLDVQPADRHLLLLVRENGEKSKFLCGHDERHWFVAGIPEAAPVGTVRQAKEALKPAEVVAAQAGKRLRADARTRRRNAAFVRQGEWFFLPVSSFAVDEKLVLRWEPLTRGNGGKPHWTEFLYRTGGETVYVCTRHRVRSGRDRGRRHRQLLDRDELERVRPGRRPVPVGRARHGGVPPGRGPPLRRCPNTGLPRHLLG